jgi:DnaJ domain
MSEKVALKAAIDLMHVPSQVRVARSEPLPDGVLTVLRIAAGDSETEQAAIDLTGRSLGTLRRAAAFFIEQILLAPDADSYRVLGVSPQASAGELRRNVALLLRWLHPDLDPQGIRSIFAGRVTTAWNNLKTPERRAAYDNSRQPSKKRSKSRSKNGKSRIGRAKVGQQQFMQGHHHRGTLGPAAGRVERAGLLRRALSVLFHRSR